MSFFIQRVKANKLLIEIVENCADLYEKNGLDEVTADSSIPALNAIYQHFVKNWKISLSTSVPLKVKTSQRIENIKRASNLLQITRSSLYELYEELAGRLWNLQSKGKRNQRDFFQYTKPYSGFENLEEILPKSLSHFTLKSQKVSSNHKKRISKSPITTEIATSAKDINESNIPCSSIDEELNMPLTIRKKTAF